MKRGDVEKTSGQTKINFKENEMVRQTKKTKVKQQEVVEEIIEPQVEEVIDLDKMHELQALRNEVQTLKEENKKLLDEIDRLTPEPTIEEDDSIISHSLLKKDNSKKPIRTLACKIFCK